MNARDVAPAARWLDALGIEYVVVGGSAIEIRHSVGTKDIDVLIAVGDWANLDRALEGRRDATPLDPFSGTIRATKLRLNTQMVDVEFISGEPFCGERAADDFVHFVRSRHSEIHGGVRYADPAVVWYMRLSTEDWQTYVLKIEQDLRAGVPAETLDQVVEVAAHFGVRRELAARTAFVRKTLDLFEPAQLKRADRGE